MGLEMTVSAKPTLALDGLLRRAELIGGGELTPEIVRDCVRASEWMFLDGPDDDPTKQRVETRGADEQESPPSAPSGRYR